MKIERINDNQIRCTLTKEDLERHHIRLSELAYGTEKAKQLFRDMMQQAQQELGFESDNTPLMIEAIPVNADSIILIITKVDDPEELDTRFSKFAPHRAEEESTLQFNGADNIIDIFQKIYEAKMKALGAKSGSKPTGEPSNTPPEAAVNLVHLYTFSRLDDIIEASHGLNHFYNGENSLYKDARSRNYLLVVHQSSCTPEEFNKVCNILSEYGDGKSFSQAGEAHLLEHGEIIISKHALQELEQL